MLLNKNGIYKASNFAATAESLIQSGIISSPDTVVKIDHHPFSNTSINQKINSLPNIPDGEKMLMKLSIPYDVSGRLDTVKLSSIYQTQIILSARIAELEQVFSAVMNEALSLRTALIRLVNDYTIYDSFITAEKNFIQKNLGEINSLIHGLNNIAWKTTKLPSASEVFLYYNVKNSILSTSARRTDSANIPQIINNIVWLADKIANSATVDALGDTENSLVVLSIMNDRINEINSKLALSLTTAQTTALVSERLQLRAAQRDLVNAKVTSSIAAVINSAYKAGTEDYINQQLSELDLDAEITATTRNYFKYDSDGYVSLATAAEVTSSPITTAWQITLDLLETQKSSLQRDIDFLNNTNISGVNSTQITTLTTKRNTINQVITNITNVLDDYYEGRVVSITVTLGDDTSLTFLNSSAFNTWSTNKDFISIVTGPGNAKLGIQIIDPITAPNAYRIDIIGVPYVFVNESEYQVYQTSPSLFTTTPGFGNAVYVNRIIS